MVLKKTVSDLDKVADVRRYKRDLEGLLAQLQDADPGVRRWAARDLSAYREAAATLCQRLEQEGDPAVREAIATALAKIGGPEVVSGLIELLRSDDAALRNLVIEVLQEIPKDLEGQIEGLLRDLDPDVRIFAVNIMGLTTHPKLEQWLISVLEEDPHVNVVATALDQLCEIGTEASLPALALVRKRFPQDPFILFSAEMAEKRIKG
jgi:HEAT repeat protein|uniref:HEAT repeat domain-containing protein n=1 Tax=Desulfobacca acetoxidans TaxID=60893 RepID=A0A7C3WJI6_9BACT